MLARRTSIHAMFRADEHAPRAGCVATHELRIVERVSPSSPGHP
jgi:hypothetical protein